MRRACLFASLLALLAAGCGGEEGPNVVAETVEQKLRYDYAEKHGQAWALLHPAHRAIAPRSLYVRCAGRIPIPARVKSVEVLDVYPNPVGIYGIPEDVETRAVRVRVTDTVGRYTRTFHAARQKRVWYAVLPERAVRSFRRGRCS